MSTWCSAASSAHTDELHADDLAAPPVQSTAAGADDWQGDQRLLSVGARLDTLSDDSANDSGNAFADHRQSRVAVCAHADEPQPGVDSAGPETPVRPAGRLVLMGLVPDQFTPVVAKFEPVRRRHDCHVVDHGLDPAEDHEDVSSRLRHGREYAGPRPAFVSLLAQTATQMSRRPVASTSEHQSKGGMRWSKHARSPLRRTRPNGTSSGGTTSTRTFGRSPRQQPCSALRPRPPAGSTTSSRTPSSLLTTCASSGIPEHVIEAVESVTKGPGRSLRRAHLPRLCQHPLGRLVKLVDNAWNITCNPALAADRSRQGAATS